MHTYTYNDGHSDSIPVPTYLNVEMSTQGFIYLSHQQMFATNFSCYIRLAGLFILLTFTKSHPHQMNLFEGSHNIETKQCPSYTKASGFAFFSYGRKGANLLKKEMVCGSDVIHTDKV